MSSPSRCGSVVGEGLENWQTIAASRDWDEVIQLLALHPSAGLSADGQMTDAMLADLSRRRDPYGTGPVGLQRRSPMTASLTSRGCRPCSTST